MMKKIYNVAILLIALISCVIFTACGDRYANIEMSFYTADGARIDSLNLVIDKSGSTPIYEDVEIAVRFSNIDTDDIGQIEISSSPSELVTVTNYRYSDDMCYVNVRANMASEQLGQLRVKHLASGATASIDLRIDQKSKSINVSDSTYVVAIPDEGEKTVEINASEVVSLSPSGSTDKIYFKAQDTNTPSNIEFTTTEVNGETLITGFTINSNVAEDTILRLNPVTTMTNYENVTYSDKTVTFTFISTLVESDIRFSTDSLHQSYLDNNETIHLIANDTSADISNQYNFNNFLFTIQYNSDNNEYLALSDRYLNYYDVVWSEVENFGVESIGDGSRFLVYCTDMTTDSRQITFSIVPKAGYVGEIDSISKAINVKGEIKPSDIEVTMQGETVNVNESLDLYDYYSSTGGSALGALFHFIPTAEPISQYIYQDLSNMRIIVNPEILNNVSGTQAFNNIYTDDTFTVLDTNPVDYQVRANKYVLNIYLYNQPMRFYYDRELRMMISEPIDSADNIYIHYEETDNDSNDFTLGISVEAYYSGELQYLENIESITVDLTFNRRQGVSDLTVNAGILGTSNNAYIAEIYRENDGSDIPVQNLYLNRLEGTDSNLNLAEGQTGTAAYLLYIGEGNVLGDDALSDSDRVLRSAEFEVTVTGGRDNPLTLKQYNSSTDDNGKDKLDPAGELIEIVGETQITYSFNLQSGVTINNAILLVFRQDTDIGNYTITFTHANGYQKVLNCLVYERMESEDIDLDIDENDSLFKNYDEISGEYEYENYKSDYIVASQQETDLNVVLDSIFTWGDNQNRYVRNYTYTPSLFIDEGSALDITNENVNNYITVENAENSVQLRFNRGTSLDNQPFYIRLDIILTVQDYANIITPISEGRSVSVSISFYVYNQINSNDMSIVAPGDRYTASSLGVYYADQSIAHLELNLTDASLWEYIQDVDKSIIGNDYTTGGSETNYKVEWYISDESIASFVDTIAVTSNSITLRFNNIQTDSLVFTVYARSMQFRTEILLSTRITVRNSIVTESIQILSELNKTDDNNENYYLDLKAGESVQIEARNYSSLGDVTNEDVFIVVADNFGNQSRAVTVDNITKTITAGTTNLASELNIIIFARDALIYEINSSTQGFDNIQDFLMDGNEEISYKNAYFVITLYLTDGSATNPYIINDANDFWDIDLNEESLDAHYRLMTNVDITDTSTALHTISNFSGTITSHSVNGVDYIYSLYGFTLTNDVRNLFSNFSGTIENVNFVVNYAYSVSTTDSLRLGVFDRNIGTLTNVSVNISGNTSLNNSQDVVFGGLVAENEGYIEYNSDTIIGSTGSLTMSGTAVVSFGGLVGENMGVIVGCYDADDTDDSQDQTTVDLSVYILDGGAMASINIVANLNANSQIGGLVGYNGLNGSIANAYVTGSISSNTNNVGGVIGRNESVPSNVTINLNASGAYIDSVDIVDSEYTLTNVVSSVVLTGNNYIGGIVGYDIGGSYYNCDYQILPNSSYGISGNIYIGGIAGWSDRGLFSYCSVYSYRWDYTHLDTTFTLGADIIGTNSVAGIVGSSSAQTNDNGYGVVIMNSSTNAYLSGNKNVSSGQIGNVGGMINSDNSPNDPSTSVVFNAYFIGKIDGHVTYTSNLEQSVNIGIGMGSIITNNVYSIILTDSDTMIGFYQNNIYMNNNDTWINGTSWAVDSAINGGYNYILNPNGDAPLFELAPSSLTVTISDEYQDNVLTANTLYLDYYQFTNLDSSMENYTSIYQALTNIYNTHDILDVFEFSCTPEVIKVLRLTASSDNNSVIYIANGQMIVRGVGQANITFSSALNPTINYTVAVVVDYPIPDTIILSASALGDNSINGQTISIANGMARQFYVSNIGTITYDRVQYTYIANQNISLEVSIPVSAEEYISIQGDRVLDEENGNAIYTLGSSTPLTVSVIKYSQDGRFAINVRPYITIEYGDGQSVTIYYDDIFTFYVETKLGASDISINYDSAILYPNDDTYITAYLTTDIVLDGSEISTDISLYDENGDMVSDTDSIILEIVEVGQWDENTNRQNIVYVLIVDETWDYSELMTVRVDFTISTGKVASAEFTILPQRINKIDVKNYVYIGKNIERSDYLRPNADGLIIIDIAPINGYYDYLEISDITGREEIVFAQLDGVGGNRLDEMDRPSSDGRGIRLVKTNDSSIYVATAIDRYYSSIVHTIRVSAYLDSGDQVGEPTHIEIDVRMLPTITMEYLQPNGVVYEENDSFNSTPTFFIANGVTTSFRITTQNSNGDIIPEISITGNYNVTEHFEIVEVYNGIFELRALSLNTTLVGQTVTLSFTTTSNLDNGTVETATVAMNLRIVNFMIYDISISPSRVNSNNVNEIYGDYESEVTLEFYFDEEDILFNENNSFGDTIYRYDETITADNASPARFAINEILRELNTNNFTDTGYRYYQFFNLEDDIVSSITSSDMSIDGNQIIVHAGKTGIRLELYPTFVLDDNLNWLILPYDTEAYMYRYESTYYLNFSNSNSFEEPEVITTAEEFLNMSAGENMNYILACDITLTDYTPMDIVLNTFDGNGHTITIESFAPFTDQEINAGLFREIYEGMVVMNLTVNYRSIGYGIGDYSLGHVEKGVSSFSVDYADICNSTDTVIDYESAYFGAIASVNNGIITNCKSAGTIALSASTLEEKASNNYEIAFYIGGLVAVNGSTGYITNSTSGLDIFALANIGGVAYENQGKIASTVYDATGDFENTNTGLIFAHNSNIQYTNITQVAGFVVSNSGEISMSAVEAGTTSLNYGATIGNISAKDISSGFVYQNTGSIYDCYVDLELVGNNQNTFYGFIATQTNNSIARAYTYINQGVRTNNIRMFAPNGTEGISDCYELVLVQSGYINQIPGITTLDINNVSIMTQQSSYPAFAFGDNTSAVWTMTGGDLPKLVSCLERVEYTARENTDSMYYGLRNIRIITTEVTDEDGHITYLTSYEILNSGYGSKNNPYIIYDVPTWDYYMTQVNDSMHYYRLVTDLDFSTVYENPSTSVIDFMGNIQGNNMDISGLRIYTTSTLEGIGLFRKTMSADDLSIVNAIRNIDITADSILATKTQAVGALAGIIEDFDIYNVDITANDIIVGANAVGGLAGVVRGDFDLEMITSDASVNSIRTSSGYRYSIYLSRNNTSDNTRLEASENLSSVYYAGSIAGILDGYSNASYDIDDTREINSSNYFEAKKLSVNGDIVGIGDTVGGMFGFVGERVRVEDADIVISEGQLKGAQYSAGLVGENRGVISNVSVYSESENAFADSSSVSAGLVGLNLGGFISDATVYINVIDSSSNTKTVAGIVGRNVNGYIYDSTYQGNVMGYITGGIIGAMYSDETLLARTGGSGAISSDSQVAIPSDTLRYSLNSETLEDRLSNLTLSNETIEYWFENMSNFYTFASGRNSLTDALLARRVLGLFIGLSDNDEIYNFGLNSDQDLVFAFANEDISSYRNSYVGLVTDATLTNGVSYDTPFANILEYSANGSIVTYLIGAEVESFDAWNRQTYSNDMLIFTDETNNIIKLNHGEELIYITTDSLNTNTTNHTYAYELHHKEGADITTLHFEYSFVSRYLTLDQDDPISVYINGTELTTDEGSGLTINAEDKYIEIDLSEVGDVSKVCTISFSGSDGEGTERVYQYIFTINS